MLLEGQGAVLNEVLTACEVEEIALGEVQSILLKLLLPSLILAWVLADSELRLAAVVCEI